MSEQKSIALALVPGTLFVGMAGGIVFPILPIVGQRVGLSLPFIGIILAANRAVRVVLAPSIGMLTDRIGGRRTMLIGMLIQIFVSGAYFAGMVWHREGLFFLGGRLLHGVGSACVFIAAQALALHAGESSGKSGSTAAAVRVSIVLGVPVGFVAGGVLSEAFGEEKTFVIAAASAAVAFVAAAFTVPDLRVKVRTPRSIRESLGALRDRRLAAVGGLNFALTFAAGGMLLTTLALLVDTRHLVLFGQSAHGTSGMLMGLMSIVDAGVTPFLGRLGDRYRAHARVAAASTACVALGVLIVALSSGIVGTASGVALVGVGAGGLGPSALVLVGLIVPPENRGAGVGLLQLCGDVGGMLGPLVGTALLAGDPSRPYELTAFLVACFVPIALSLVPVERAALR